MAKRTSTRRVAPEEGVGVGAGVGAGDAGLSVGPLLAAARKRRGWTLQDLGAASGVAIGTLSKIENGKSGASFDTIVRVAGALEMSFDDILGPNSPSFASGRRAITKAGDGVKFGFGSYQYEIPCNDLVSKAMIPLIMNINIRDLMPRNKWQTHPGEEYIYVLSGSIEMHTEIYGPAKLEAGDSAYIDSMMAHAFVNVGAGEAKMLSICLSNSLNELFGRRAMITADGASLSFDNDKY